MAPQKIYDSKHQGNTIYKWKKYGLILKEGQTYKDIYSYVMSIERCQRCGINFDNEIHNQRRCMDHNHHTGYFRQVLCHRCNKGFDISLRYNSKTGHNWISPSINKKQNGDIYVPFQYQRKGFKTKKSLSLTKLIAYSFINILKVPV